MVIGSGDLQFEFVDNWQFVPSGDLITEGIGVAVDSKDHVFVFNRSDGTQPAVLEFDRDCNLLNQWGDSEFVRPHGIWVTPQDTLILTDDLGHRIRHFTTDGKLLHEIGPSDGVPIETGVEGFDYRKIQPGFGPFNKPTNAVTDSIGDIFAADGYGNARVHHFSATGDLIKSWGNPGDGVGEFNVPHGMGIDANDRLYVGDRENSRIQIYSTDGELLETWTDVVRPCEIFVAHDGLVYVAELGKKAGLFEWQEKRDDAIGGRISIFDQDGQLLCRWGGGENPGTPYDYYAPHDIWVDSEGSIYLGEVSLSAARVAGLEPKNFPTLRKYRRV